MLEHYRNDLLDRADDLDAIEQRQRDQARVEQQQEHAADERQHDQEERER